MIERLIALVVIAMVIIIIVPLTIAIGIWIRNRVRERKFEAAKERQRLFDDEFKVNRERIRKQIDQIHDYPRTKRR